MTRISIKAHKAISVNSYGEFDQGCLCGNGDFFTVVKDGDRWIEIEPVTPWDGWACIACNRVFSDGGDLLDTYGDVVWMYGVAV